MASVSGYSASSVVLALYTYNLTTNLAVGVTARAAAGVSVRVAARMAARNKPMRLISSRLLSQLSVA